MNQDVEEVVLVRGQAKNGELEEKNEFDEGLKRLVGREREEVFPRLLDFQGLLEIEKIPRMPKRVVPNECEEYEAYDEQQPKKENAVSHRVKLLAVSPHRHFAPRVVV
jgi:hypothetical protein